MKSCVVWLSFFFLGASCATHSPLRSQQIPASPASTESVGAAPLANGVYAVHAIAPDPNTFTQANASHRVLIDDGRFLAPEDRGPARYLLIATDAFVPLKLAAKPEIGTGPKGNPMLGISLDKAHSALLERFSRANLYGETGRFIVVMIDNQVVTVHKIREPLTEGRIQITRCTDTACQMLLVKLSE